MAEFDAGIYEVKIHSISYNGDSDPACNATVLPLLEFISSLAPIIFTVQPNYTPLYDPSSIIYVTGNTEGRIELVRAVGLDLSLRVRTLNVYHDWYRNGTRLSNGRMYDSTATNQNTLSLQITYNNTADIIGDYERILWFDYDFLDDLRSGCRGYYRYLRNIAERRFAHYNIPFRMSFWKIEEYSKYVAN